jgi:hypothetical protein
MNIIKNIDFKTEFLKDLNYLFKAYFLLSSDYTEFFLDSERKYYRIRLFTNFTKKYCF